MIFLIQKKKAEYTVLWLGWLKLTYIDNLEKLLDHYTKKIN